MKVGILNGDSDLEKFSMKNDVVFLNNFTNDSIENFTNKYHTIHVVCSSEYVSLFIPNQQRQYFLLSRTSPRHFPGNFNLPKIPSLFSRFGKIGFLFGKELFHPERYSSEIFDVLISCKHFLNQIFHFEVQS
jgi:hypothetical protein